MFDSKADGTIRRRFGDGKPICKVAGDVQVEAEAVKPSVYTVPPRQANGPSAGAQTTWRPGTAGRPQKRHQYDETSVASNRYNLIGTTLTPEDQGNAHLSGYGNRHSMTAGNGHYQSVPGVTRGNAGYCLRKPVNSIHGSAAKTNLIES
mmetsp:Transcript_5597/g.12293  ORF Transcript_5597/g.12293 Transcript_5597/m.12293 type:complete len:149 (+) Transcript_5597:3-449(+)